MAVLSRRTFLIRGSLGAAAAAIASAVPGLPTLATSATEDTASGEDSAAVVADELSATSDPVVAHVTDLRTGQVSVFVGEREYAVVDRALASRLVQVTK